MSGCGGGGGGRTKARAGQRWLARIGTDWHGFPRRVRKHFFLPRVVRPLEFTASFYRSPRCKFSVWASFSQPFKSPCNQPRWTFGGGGVGGSPAGPRLSVPCKLLISQRKRSSPRLERNPLPCLSCSDAKEPRPKELERPHRESLRSLASAT